MAIGTTFDYQVPISDQFAAIAPTVFELVSLGGNHEHSGYLSAEGRQSLKKLAKRHGIGLDSLHVPFDSKYDLACSRAEARMAAVCRVAICMVAAKELGANTIIVHLDADGTDGSDCDRDSLLLSLEALVESAEIMNLRLAAENLPRQESLSLLDHAFDVYKSKAFGFCYDSSHDMLTSEKPYEILERYANRLFALHLSDNDGREDRHWLPFTGVVDWQRICQILRRNRYDFPLLLEVENRDRIETNVFLQKAAEAATRLQTMIQG